MGLFGFVGKALKKVATVGLGLVKKGASAATGGVSDVVFDEAKKVLNPSAARIQKVAAAAFEKELVPKIKVTERAEGWNFSPDAYGGYKKGKVTGKPSAAKMIRSYVAAGKAETRARKKAAKPPRKSGAAQPVLQAQVARSSGRKTRVLPAKLRAQAERTKALAAVWRAAGGQAGTGQTFFAWKVGR